MRTQHVYTCIFSALLLFLIGCKKPVRDNPLDAKNPAVAVVPTSTTATTPTGTPNVRYSRYEVYSDDNNNGQVDHGETATLKVYLKNTGNAQAINVHASVYCNFSNMAVLNGDYENYYYYGISSNNFINAGQEGFPASGEYLKFVVGSAASNTTLTFGVSIFADSGTFQPDSFKVFVH